MWGTLTDDNIVWGTFLDDNIVWGTDCGGANCEGVIWGALANDSFNIVWGTAESLFNIVWGTNGAVFNIVWGTLRDDNIVWGTDDNIVWGTSAEDNVVWADDAIETGDTWDEAAFEQIFGIEPALGGATADDSTSGSGGGGL